MKNSTYYQQRAIILLISLILIGFSVMWHNVDSYAAMFNKVVTDSASEPSPALRHQDGTDRRAEELLGMGKSGAKFNFLSGGAECKKKFL